MSYKDDATEETVRSTVMYSTQAAALGAAGYATSGTISGPLTVAAVSAAAPPVAIAVGSGLLALAVLDWLFDD